jgi:aminopeptidase N
VWLYTLGVARFAVHHPTPVGGVPLESWVFPQEREPGWQALEETSRQVLGFYSARIAPYPYDKLANVEAAGIHGGMESATAIFYGEGDFKGGRMTMLLAHEIAHQWFGNAVTESDWNEVWLSEGFATYLADCFLEQAEGRDAFVKSLKDERTAVIAAEKQIPDTPIVHLNLTDMGKVLNLFVYEKGAWVLHMLRGAVGEDAFWRGLRAYYLRHQHGNATTADFRQAMEGASGQKLDGFFSQWLTRPGVPKLAGSWRFDGDRKEVIVDLQQTQVEAAFLLPLTLAFGERQETVQLSRKQQQFTFPAQVAPAYVAVDPRTEALIEAPEQLERRP